MQQAFSLAMQLVLAADPQLFEIVRLSLRVSLLATAIACLLGLPIGALLATAAFPGKWLLNVLVNTLMGMPPVVIGLLVYLLFSRAGPLGWLQWLYTPTAMIIAQVILITPIVAALSRQVIEDAYQRYQEHFRSLCLTPLQVIQTVLFESRYSLLTVALAGFGRAIAEVGAVMIVGGNIAHLTRVMTTAIALETSKGALALALALGLILLCIALTVNVAAMMLKSRLIAHAN